MARAWQAMRFVTRDLPGPRATPFIRAMQDLERDLEYVTTHPESDPEVVQAFMETIVEPTALKILTDCRSVQASLG